MTKAKATRNDRTKRAPRDMSAERHAEVSDGRIVEDLDELDTDKYEPPTRKEH